MSENLEIFVGIDIAKDTLDRFLNPHLHELAPAGDQSVKLPPSAWAVPRRFRRRA